MGSERAKSMKIISKLSLLYHRRIRRRCKVSLRTPDVKQAES